LSNDTNPPSPATEHDSRDGFRPDIEGLRGLAILLVVSYHAGLPLSGGFIGVDVFFVISGFLITGLLMRDRQRNGSIRIGAFYARRVKRLLPAAAVVLVATLLVANRLVAPLDRPSISVDGVAAALSVANIRFAITADYFSPVGAPSPFLHFWSLGVEEQFYLVWPALLAVAAFRRPRLGAGIVLGVVFAASLAASILVTEASPSLAFYMLPTRAWELAAGGLLAIGVSLPAGLRAHVPQPFESGAQIALGLAAWLGLAAIVASAALLDSNVAYPGLVALLPTAGTVALIAGGERRLGPGWLMGLSPARFLGRISYSLYLWHWPVLVLGGLALGGTLVFGQTVGLVGIALALAVATWAFVEEPFRRGTIPMPAHASRTIALGITALLVVAFVGSSLEGSEVAALAALSSSADVVSVPQPSASPAGGSSGSAAPGRPDPTAPRAGPTPVPGSRATPPPTAKPKPATSFALTASVRPALIDARTDYERTWHDGCLGNLASTTPANCVYAAKKGAFTVALVGDSHASALFPAVEAVASAHGWRLLTFVKVSCPFMDIPIYSDMLKREYTECATWNAKVVARLQAAKPDLILVSNSRWVFPLNAADQNRVKQGQALARMIKQVPGRVAIIVDVPLPGIDVPACLSDHPTDVRLCAVPRRQALGSGMGIIESTAASETGARLINMTKAICPGTGACPVVIDNMIVYRDQHHLTATFSRTLAPVLDQKLRAILGLS
jgi:peptidoglycan/LPS O-acetylase OafA/YrhL